MTRTDPITAARRVYKLYRPSVPIRPEDIAKKMGITVVGARLSKRLSGLLVPEVYGNNVQYFIFVNTRHPRERQRFSMAHELGHFFLHREVGPLFSHGKCQRAWFEWEANKFAAELLMPEDSVRFSADFLDDIDLLAQFFEVSKAAMKWRLKELNITVKEGAIA